MATRSGTLRAPSCALRSVADGTASWVVSVVGGSPRRFADVPGEDGTWMPNGRLLVAHENQLIQVDSTGGANKFTEVPEPNYSTWWLRWSPDARLKQCVSGVRFPAYHCVVQSRAIVSL